MTAHAQKPDFVFRRNGRVHLNRRGASIQSTTGSRVVRISGSNVGYTTFRGSVKSTGCPLHSPVSPSLAVSCVTVWHHLKCVVVLIDYTFLTLISVSSHFNWSLPRTPFLKGPPVSADPLFKIIWSPRPLTAQRFNLALLQTRKYFNLLKKIYVLH